MLIDNKELIRKADSYIEIIKYLMPIAGMFFAQLSVSMFIFLLYEALVESLGTVYLAVTHILSMTFALVRTMIAGFAEGGSILIGNHLGIGNRDIAVRYAYRQS